jgi:hypothetical protein
VPAEVSFASTPEDRQQKDAGEAAAIDRRKRAYPKTRSAF